jgi:hypothetical protein
MNSLVHRVKTILLILCVVLIGIVNPITAQEESLVPVAFAETDVGIVFYDLTADNTLAEMGRLPANFSLSTTNAEWHLAGWWGNNIVLSPDGKFIAFTAHNSDQTGLFIYSVVTGEIQQGFADDYGDWIFYLQWSPDSSAILSRVQGADSGNFPDLSHGTMIYEIESGDLHGATNNPKNIEFNLAWSPDSQGIAYTGRGTQNGVMVTDRDGKTQRQLVNFDTDPPITSYADACNYTWSDNEQRWYYVAGCPHYADSPWDDRIYSVDLQGNYEVEADFPAFYEQKFYNTQENYSAFNAVSVHSLHAVNEAVYAVVNIQASNTPQLWNVLSVSAIESPLFTYEVTGAGDLWIAEFSSDNLYVALANHRGLLVIGNLIDGKLLAELPFETRYPNVRWMSDNSLLYRSASDVLLFSVADDKTTNLSAILEDWVFLLPQTNSVWIYAG